VRIAGRGCEWTRQIALILLTDGIANGAIYVLIALGTGADLLGDPRHLRTVR
jgi:hypothetical protein